MMSQEKPGRLRAIAGLLTVSTLLLGPLLAWALLAGPGCDLYPGKQAGPPLPSVHTPFPKDTAFYVVKNGAPYILLNVASDVPALDGVDAAQQETYLLRRALANVVDVALARPEYAGKDRFVVKMVLVPGTDEYSRDAWGRALPLASFELDRAAVAGLTPSAIDDMGLEQARSLFATRQLNLDNIKASRGQAG